MAASEFLEALKSAYEVELSVKKQEKWTTRPVWFVVDGHTVYLLPVNGTDTKWYKHVTIDPEIQLSVNGKKVRGEAKAVDAQKLTDVINQFRSKYGDLERYYRKLDAGFAVAI